LNKKKAGNSSAKCTKARFRIRGNGEGTFEESAQKHAIKTGKMFMGVYDLPEMRPKNPGRIMVSFLQR
jgi:hypothetical protein